MVTILLDTTGNKFIDVFNGTLNENGNQRKIEESIRREFPYIKHFTWNGNIVYVSGGRLELLMFRAKEMEPK